jgi:HK97 family phage portal protein
VSRRQRYQLVEEGARVGLVRRIAHTMSAMRSSWSAPLTSNSPEFAKWFGGGPTLSGIRVTEDSAMSFSAVWSAVTMISDDIASLPLHLYKRLPNGGKDRFEDHQLYRLLHDAPNPEMDSMVFRRTMQAHALMWQNAYAEIERDQANRPIAMWPLVPERVSVFRQAGRLRYRVQNPSGGEVLIDPEDMIHLVGQSHDGTVGCSLIEKARESLALGLAAEKFGATFFGNGSAVGGVISYEGPRPTEMSDKNYRESLEVRHQGVERAHKLLALYNGAKYARTIIPPNEGQFNETRIFQIREVARWFKMPPHRLGDLADATYSNVEQMDAAYLSACIRPWLVLWQQQLSRKLIARSERMQQFIEHDTHGFLSVDAAGRAALYPAEFNVGALTPNEIRGYENRDPLDGGDRAYIQRNMTPIDRIDELIDAEIAVAKAKAEAPQQQQQVQNLKNALTEKQRELDTMTAERDAVRVELQDAIGLKHQANAALAERAADLLREREAHAETTSQKNAEIGRLTAHGTSLGTDLGKAAADLAEQAGVLDLMRGEFTAATARVDATLVERDRAFEERDAAVARATKAEADHQFEAQARQQAVARELELQARLDGAEAARAAAVTSADADRATAAATLASVTEERDAAVYRYTDGQAHIARVEAEYGALVVEHRTLATRVETADAVIAELRTQNVALQAGVDTAQAGIVEAREAIARAETKLTDAEAARTALMASAMAAEAEAEQAARRLAATRDAMKGVLIDTIGRQLQRESDRARKAQASPDKLRSWMRTFYPVQDEYFRSSVRPAVRALLASVGRETRIDAVLDEFVAEFLEHSQRQLTLVAAETDAETLAPALEKVLRRWDTDRAEQAADALLRKVA